MELTIHNASYLPQPKVQPPREPCAIKGFLETSFVDWPGKVVAVLFTPGCNFRCPFCHNHLLVLKADDCYEDIPFDYIIGRLHTVREWLDGVCITGGEPTIHANLPSLIKDIKSLGLAVKLDTNGSRPQVVRSLVEEGLVDYIAMDIKAPLDEVSYSKSAGVSIDVDSIRETISYLKRSNIQYEFRTTVVPALHKGEDLLHLAHQIRGASSLTLQNFNPQDPLDKGLKSTTPYTDEWLQGMEQSIASILSQQ